MNKDNKKSVNEETSERYVRHDIYNIQIEYIKRDIEDVKGTLNAIDHKADSNYHNLKSGIDKNANDIRDIKWQLKLIAVAVFVSPFIPPIISKVFGLVI